LDANTWRVFRVGVLGSERMLGLNMHRHVLGLPLFETSADAS
jgi:hypothetical protein